MKELISKEDMNSVVDYDLDEGCLEWGYLMNLRRMANQRHEEAMNKSKDIAFQAWMIQFNGDKDAISYFFRDLAGARKDFEEWYNEKYG